MSGMLFIAGRETSKRNLFAEGQDSNLTMNSSQAEIECCGSELMNVR